MREINARHFYGMSEIRKQCSEIQIRKQNENHQQSWQISFFGAKCKKEKFKFTSHSI